ncbi:MAG: DUF1501 domain-containing protein [Pirellulales bacterium]|nr:DUF1501 domain-containing protein [Pirellulales bacterium]
MARSPFTRREILKQTSMGFGALALSDLLLSDRHAMGERHQSSARDPHQPPKARSVIFLYMDGGISQVDSFDPKPHLKKQSGMKAPFKTDPTVFNNQGGLLPSPWTFQRYGESGIPFSSLFPHLGSCADDLCVIRSMTAFLPDHPNANYALHSGYAVRGRPSMGSWISYGLGSMNKNLPGYVVLHGGQVPPGGLTTFGNGFLPAKHQGSIFSHTPPAVRNLRRSEATAELQETKLRYLRQFDRQLLAETDGNSEIEAAIANYELAFRMQLAVPEAMDLSQETEETKRLYGIDSKFKPTSAYGTQCLLARRMVERGVRFIELTICKQDGVDRWDQHGNLRTGHPKNARAVDQPIAGLIKDLKRRGLLDSTLLVFTSEFGRTPFAQGKDGRDHNPQGFSMWMAGGGIRGGVAYGATDEWGYRAIENKVNVNDLHANILHLLGIDHKQLTYHYSSRDFRLTDVGGRIIPEILI